MFKIQDLIDYLEKTTEDSWCVDVIRKNEEITTNCFFGHLFDFAGGDKKDKSGYTKGGIAWDFFEEHWTTTYMKSLIKKEQQQDKLCDVDSCTGDHDEALNTNKYNAACSCGCIKGQVAKQIAESEANNSAW